MESNTKKYLIGAGIVALIIIAIIWYRNVQKNKAATIAKQNLGTGTSSNTVPPVTAIGKSAYVKTTATFYKTTDFSIAYVKNIAGEWAGDITADKTNEGNTSFYKLTNSNGQSVYVLKSQVTAK